MTLLRNKKPLKIQDGMAGLQSKFQNFYAKLTKWGWQTDGQTDRQTSSIRILEFICNPAKNEEYLWKLPPVAHVKCLTNIFAKISLSKNNQVYSIQ